jgi:hypothetical protein
MKRIEIQYAKFDACNKMDFAIYLEQLFFLAFCQV